MKKDLNFALAMTLFCFLILIVLIVGWVMNIVGIVHSHAMSGMLVARVIGVFVAPLGGVLGYF